MGRIPFCFYTTICSVLYFKVSLVYHFSYNTVTLFLFCCFWQGVKSLKEKVRPPLPPLNPPLHKLLFLSSRETAKFRTQKPSWSQKSGNAMFWSGKSGHVKVLSRKYGHESGTSTREDRSKTAQNLLEKPFKNHRKKWAVFERFFKQYLSSLSGFSKINAQTAQTAQILLENRSNRSNLERFLSGISTRVSS